MYTFSLSHVIGITCLHKGVEEDLDLQEFGIGWVLCIYEPKRSLSLSHTHTGLWYGNSCGWWWFDVSLEFESWRVCPFVELLRVCKVVCLCVRLSFLHFSLFLSAPIVCVKLDVHVNEYYWNLILLVKCSYPRCWDTFSDKRATWDHDDSTLFGDSPEDFRFTSLLLIM